MRKKISCLNSDSTSLSDEYYARLSVRDDDSNDGFTFRDQNNKVKTNHCNIIQIDTDHDESDIKIDYKLNIFYTNNQLLHQDSSNQNSEKQTENKKENDLTYKYMNKIISTLDKFKQYSNNTSTLISKMNIDPYLFSSDSCAIEKSTIEYENDHFSQSPIRSDISQYNLTESYNQELLNLKGNSTIADQLKLKIKINIENTLKKFGYQKDYIEDSDKIETQIIKNCLTYKNNEILQDINSKLKTDFIKKLLQNKIKNYLKKPTFTDDELNLILKPKNEKLLLKNDNSNVCNDNSYSTCDSFEGLKIAQRYLNEDI